MITYFFAAEPYDGWVKIGRTDGPIFGRLRACQTGNPNKLVARATWWGDTETFMHTFYRPFRGRGEWFALPRPLLDDAVRVATRERAHVELLALWHPRRIWAFAGVPEGTSAQDLAVLFRDEIGADRTRTAHDRAGKP